MKTEEFRSYIAFLILIDNMFFLHFLPVNVNIFMRKWLDKVIAFQFRV